MIDDLPCGHPAADTHTADEGTRHCPACEAKARADSNHDWCMWCGHWRVECECECDEDDDSPPPRCPSCGVAYRKHLGPDGTCAEVQQLRAALAETLGWMRWEGVTHVRSEWVHQDRVAELRRLVGVKP